MAQDAVSAGRPEVLPHTCEMNLALSAAPQHLRDGAGVYVLGEDGYVLDRDSQNGFTCIVNRDHPRVLKPTCFDAEGTATIVPKIVRFGDLLLQGKSVEEINQIIAQGFDDGTFTAPRRPGVAYMLSDYNRPYNPQTDELGWFPPHLMFYAPNLDNEDIGSSWEANREDHWLPFIGYQGPHGFMIVRVQEASTPQPEDAAGCPEWVRQ